MATHVAHARSVRGRVAEAAVDVRVWWRAYGSTVLTAVAVVAMVAGVVLVTGIIAVHWSPATAMFLGMVGTLAAVLVAAWKWVERP
jgi:Kef-type K+ transport system membrane component KefB